MEYIYYPEQFGAVGDGKTDDTCAIQQCIDTAAKEHGVARLNERKYLTGALFLKDDMKFYLPEKACLIASTDENAFPEIYTRVAGVEMFWPAAVINIISRKNVQVGGKGTIDGQGFYWWKKFWGEDERGGMLQQYEESNIRWAVDYDCKRPRNVLVWESENIVLRDFCCIRSGFWNVHICYSRNVQVKRLTIKENQGPSTDGIDIDSSEDILVEGCDISCNDDCICIKAGRDADGLRVNRSCKNIEIRDCILREGEGMTLGSETSGGIENIQIHHLKYIGTSYGFRMKSAQNRGGFIHNVKVYDLVMDTVKTVFCWQMDWYPMYSSCVIPSGYNGEIPEYWNVLCTDVLPKDRGTDVRDIIVQNVRADRAECAFDITGDEKMPLQNIIMKDIKITAGQLGKISHLQNWQINNVEINLN